MATILNKLLLEYAGTLEIEYLGVRCAKIRFLGKCKKYWLERKLFPRCWYNGYRFNFIEDFNCNGIETTATIRLFPESKPFENIN